jgi:hypothetical protein
VGSIYVDPTDMSCCAGSIPKEINDPCYFS